MEEEEQTVEEIIEEPPGEIPEHSNSKVLEIPVENPEEISTPVAKAKPKARGKRGPDKKSRVKPKPKARAVAQQSIQPVEESESEESVDETTLQEIHSLNLLRSIRAYESQKHSRKQQMYESWFGR